MRKRQRRDSARHWIRSGADITVKAYARRYGVDRHTAHDDLSALGFPLPPPADRWAQRPPTTRRRAKHAIADPIDHLDDAWITLDGRRFFVAGHTAGGVPYGVVEEDIEPPQATWAHRVG